MSTQTNNLKDEIKQSLIKSKEVWNSILKYIDK